MALGLMGERISVNGQTGWDGKNYAELTLHLEKKWKEKSIDSYLFQRILPSAVGHHVLKGLQSLDSGYKPVVRYFLWANALLVLVCIWVYFKIVDLLKWNTPKMLIGFAAMFFNFAILKQTWYYPVLTDVFAFTCGMVLLYFYLRGNQLGMFVIMIMGSFVYPLFLLSSILLFLKLPFDVAKYFRVLIGILLLCWTVLFFSYLVDSSFIHEKYKMHVNNQLIYLSAALTILYLYRITRYVNSQWIAEQTKELHHNWLWLIASIVFFTIQFYWIRQISVPEEVFTSQTFLLNIFQQSFSNPLAFLVFHTTYFGPLVLLMVFVKNTARVCWSNGFLLYILGYLLLSIGTESRQFINVWPFMVIWFLQGLDDKLISKKFTLMFVITAIFLSKFYIPINRPDIFLTYQYDQFPEQLYFMNHGPFATDFAYAINLSICLISGLFLYFSFTKSQNQPHI